MNIQCPIYGAMLFCARAIKWVVGNYYQGRKNYDGIESSIIWNEIERFGIWNYIYYYFKSSF